MDQLQSALNRSDSCIVSGERQSGKLTLVYLLIRLRGFSRVTVISPYQKAVSGKKLRHIREQCAHVFDAVDHLEIVSLKEDWKALKQQLGYALVLADLKRLIAEANSDVVLLHRVDEFFEVQDRSYIDAFFSEITTAAADNKKKLFLTLQKSADTDQVFLGAVDKNIDLELNVSRASQAEMVRGIDVVSSVHSLHCHGYSMVVNSRGHFHITSNGSGLNGFDTTKRVLLVSEDARTISRLRYLFRFPGFKLEVIPPELAIIVSRIMTRPDLTIYAASEPSEFSLFDIADENSLKVIKISPEPHIRKQDKLKAAQQGCYELFAAEYYLEDLVLTVERALEINFYTSVFSRVPNRNHYFNEADLFNQMVKIFLDHRLYFSVFTFRVSNNDYKAFGNIHLSRPYDAVYYSEDELLLKFFAPNMMDHNCCQIEAKVSAFDPQAELLDIREAYQFRTAGVLCNE
ncbi:hypothetical protein [Marinobacterium jannaschii]|uniref:hypothetical protein n=1 Tax=Marinobacterium jannaschii TaxID=64970 RepID=UPI00048075F7|nr:hypothetical protein [Marinobacterium jannaschii]